MSIIYGNMVGGASGTDGKSAYQYAQDGGFTGTEAEFAAKLAKEIPETLPNPNALTFTGAVTGTYDGSAALSVEIPSGGGGWEVIADQTLDTQAASVSFNFDVTYRRLWFAVYGVPASGSDANLDIRFNDSSTYRIQLNNGLRSTNTSDGANKRGTQIYLEKISGGFAFILCSVNAGGSLPYGQMFSPVNDAQKGDWSNISKVVFYATGTSFSAGSIFKLWGCK